MLISQRTSVLAVACTLASGIALFDCAASTTATPEPGDVGRDSGTGPTTEGGPGTPITLAGPSRFPVGATFVLPKGGPWTLAEGPQENQNKVFEETARTLFVPHVAGAYRFVDTTSGASVTLGAVSAETLAFHNLNYFPTSALHVSGDKLWVASTLRPEIELLDRATLTKTGAVAVGSWPVAVHAVPSRNMVLVASRGDDTLTVVDATAMRATRSIFIGDEVANVVATKDGLFALAVAPNNREVVIVDLSTFTVAARVKVGVDPTHLALNAQGTKAYVAGRRTGISSEVTGADVSEIDLTTRLVTRTIADVGTTLGGLTVSPDGKTLYVAALRNNPTGSLSDPAAESFRHGIAKFDLSATSIVETLFKDETLSAVPPGGASPLAARRLVSLHSPVLANGSLWLVSEAGDLAVHFDAATLDEVERVEVPGRPRALAVASDGSAYAFGHQEQKVTEIKVEGGVLTTRSAVVAADPRPADVARGLRFFTGPGVSAQAGPTAIISGDRWSCASCHADGLSDKIVWQAGPIPTHRYASRAYVALEATYPLGWQGYLSSVRNYAQTVTGNVGITKPTTEQVTGLAAYLASLMPPPAANSLTERDGALSADGIRGKALFDVHCNFCHSGPLSTSRGRVEKSIGDGKVADIPSLLGTYRLGVWFRDGSAKTLDAAVTDMAKFSGATLSGAELADLTHYVGEITAREFFSTTEFPRSNLPLPTGASITIAHSHPVFADAKNLARVRLVDPAGANVPATVTATGRMVTLTPNARLNAATEYRAVVDVGLESESGVATSSAREFKYRTAEKANFKLDGSYTATISIPNLRAPASPPTPVTFTLVATANDDGSAKLVALYGPAPLAEWTGVAIVSGNRLFIPPIPVMSPQGGFADGFSGLTADLVDANADGVADGVSVGTSPAGARGYTYAGPGWEIKDLPWNLVRN